MTVVKYESFELKMAWREALKKPIAKPTAPKPKFDTKDDDWETDINYQNQSDEKSQRYGSKSMPGSGRIDHVDFKSIQDKLKTADNTVKQIYQDKNPNKGYGGKYGTDQVMDKSAADFSYRADLQKHSSQTDGKKGFGGAYGVDDRAKDKSAMGFDYKADVEKHPSQTDFSKGFGGKYGTDQNAQDKSAVGFAHKENVPKHPSQKDYSVGFGGKFGVQKEEPSRLPASATPPSERKSVEKATPPVGSSIGVGNIRARFENMKKEQEEEAAKRVAEERNKRAVNEKQTTSNGHNKNKEQEVPPVSYQPVRGPSPPLHTSSYSIRQQERPQMSYQPIRQPSPPPVVQQERYSPVPTQESNSSIYQNIGNQFESQKTAANEESTHFIGGVNVSSLLRQRKASSSSSKNDDDEWADDHQSNNYHHQQQQQQHQPERRSPSPTPIYSSNNNNNHHQNEGVRCIARYSYQKTEDDELGFEENEIITHVNKMHDEWWFGRIGTRSGLFPSNYVEEL